VNERVRWSWERLEQGTPSEDLWALSEACRTPLPMQGNTASATLTTNFQISEPEALIEMRSARMLKRIIGNFSKIRHLLCKTG